MAQDDWLSLHVNFAYLPDNSGFNGGSREMHSQACSSNYVKDLKVDFAYLPDKSGFNGGSREIHSQAFSSDYVKDFKVDSLALAAGLLQGACARPMVGTTALSASLPVNHFSTCSGVQVVILWNCER